MGLLGVGKARRAFGGLPPQARLMAEFLACAEQPDRVSSTVTRVWPALWGRLSQLGGPPDPWDLLPVLRKARLVVYVKLGESADLLVGFRMDPLVAAAIQQEASEQVRLAVAGELGRLWALSAEQARQVPDGEDSRQVVGAALSAAPYLLRAALWEEASVMLENVVNREPSPHVLESVITMYKQVVAATGSARHQAILARALANRAGTDAAAGLAESESLYRDAIARFVADGDHRRAFGALAELAVRFGSAGRLAEALDLMGQADSHAQQADLGPWTRVSPRVQRLALLSRSGEHARVLAEIAELEAIMAELPAQRAENDMVNPWNLRETVLGAGLTAALVQGNARQALEFSGELIAALRSRNAGRYEIARTRIYDVGSLAELGRRAEAEEVLRYCLQAFEEHGDAAMAQQARTVLADLQHRPR